MALTDVSKKIAKGTVAATVLPAFMAAEGVQRAIKPITRAALPKNILTAFANELDYFPIKAGFDSVYDRLGGRKKKENAPKPAKKVGLAEEPVPVIVKNTEDIKPEEEKPLIERLPSNFFTQTGDTSSLNRSNSMDILLQKTNELLEEIKTILSGQLLFQKETEQKKKLKDPIEQAKKRENDEEAKRLKNDFPESTQTITNIDNGNGLGMLGGLALLSKAGTIAGIGSIAAGIGAIVLGPFLETFVDQLAQGLDIQKMIPGEVGIKIDELVKSRAGDFAGKVTTFIGAKFLFGTKAAMLSVLADEVIRQVENITGFDVPNEIEGALSIAAGALAARYGKSVVTKLIPAINKTLALRFAGVLSAISLVNAIPDNPEDLQKFMDDNKKAADGLSSQIYEKLGKPLNDMLGFEFIRAQDDYENSPANKMFTSVFDSAGKSPIEMEIEEQILQAGLTGRAGKAKDDFDIGRVPVPRKAIGSDYYIDPALNKGIVPETPESINRNNQTLMNDKTGKSGAVVQYNDNRTFNTSNKSGGSSGGSGGNIGVSTSPPASSWTKRESTIRPH